jgi:hypothetical protein
MLPTEQRAPQRLVLLCLTSVFVFVYLANLDCLRIVRDDWSNLRAFASLPHQEGLPRALWLLATNQWLGLNQPRCYFFTWWIQLAVGSFDRYNASLYYGFILAWHWMSSILVYRIVRKLSDDVWVAGVVGTTFLVLPTSTQALFFLNNWFFSVPLMLLVVQVYLFVYPRRSRAQQAILLMVVTTLGQFSGEQTILMFYVSFLVFGIGRTRSSCWAERLREWGLFAAPALVSAAFMFLYVRYVVVYSVTQAPFAYSVPRALRYCRDFVMLTGQALVLPGRLFGRVPNLFYGGFDIAPSTRTVALLLIVGAVLIYTYGFRLRPDGRISRRGFAATAGALAMYFLAGLLPCLYGALAGYRPVVSSRYVYVTGFFAYGLPLAAVVAALQHLPPRIRRASGAAVAAFLCCCSVLTGYSLACVWGVQKKVDIALWAVVDAHMTDSIRYVVTDNALQDRLMPSDLSDAVSDFQADWGIDARLQAKFGRGFTVGNRAARKSDRVLSVVGYYGQQYEAADGEVMFLAYRYKPSFGGLADGRLFAFRSYDEYLRFRGDE